MTLLTNTLHLKRLEREISAVMEAVMEATVTELRRLLGLCSANATTTTSAATDQSHPDLLMETTTGGKNEKQELRGIVQEDRPQLCEEITHQFVTLMAAWTKEAVEKILSLLKASLCETEDDPAAEQRVKPKAVKPGRGVKKGLRSSGLTMREGQTCESDHSYHRGAQKPEGPTGAEDSESVIEPEEDSGSKPEVVPPEPDSELDSVVAQRETQTSSMASKKKTTEPFKCPSCDKLFTRRCMMERHHLTHSKPHLCSQCGRRFSVLRGLHAHFRRHTGEKLHRCSECGTEFAHKSTYVRHMRRHGLSKPHAHTCTLCESEFMGVLALQRHRCTALKKTFVCSLCPQTFECRQSLADHENQHSGSRDFVCEVCGEGFLSSSSLGTHRVTHCGDSLGFGISGEKLFTCEVCGKGCSHLSALKHHMLTHTGERPYVCETCGKRCGHASALQNHMRIHTGKKPGQQPVCDVCGKKFRRRVSLTYHMSVHTGVKPYACDQCDKTFSNPSNMKLHATIHTTAKTYGCIVCGRRFAQANGLKQHRRLHTGERRYSCEECGKGFMNSGDFKRHLGVHRSLESLESPGSQKL